MNTRRQFLIRAPLGFLVAASACGGDRQPPASQSTPATPGAPPTFGTGTGSGPGVSPATFAEAEKLMQVTMTAAERQQAADSWRRSLAPYLERRTGPRKVSFEASDAPATIVRYSQLYQAVLELSRKHRLAPATASQLAQTLATSQQPRDTTLVGRSPLTSAS